VWAYGRGQTDRHTDTQTQTDTQTRVTTIYFASSTTHAKRNNTCFIYTVNALKHDTKLGGITPLVFLKRRQKIDKL